MGERKGQLCEQEDCDLSLQQKLGVVGSSNPVGLLNVAHSKEELK